jgi:hypothetical protein
MEEHSLRRASITNNMHEQKRKEKGGVIGAFLSKIVNCVVLEGNVIANQSHAPHDPPPPQRGRRCIVHLSDHSIPTVFP